jgi:membrane-bound lytic murein transglycosylase A
LPVANRADIVGGVNRWCVVLGFVTLGCGESRPDQVRPIADAPRAASAAVRVDAAVAAAPCPEPAPSTTDHLTLSAVEFTELPGWADDHHAEAVPAFLASCTKLAAKPDGAPVGVDGNSGKAGQWRAPCAAAARLAPGDDAAAKAMFEREFRPYAARGDAGSEGKFTGYYVQALRGSRTRRGAFRYPIYKRPPDLVQVDLEDYLSDARGRHVWGRVDAKGVLRPYPTRAEIRGGLYDGKGLELLWVDDRVDALFTHIQGSGKVTLDDGSVVWIQFDGKNGRQYRGVGKLLRELGEPPGTGTMPGIRAWFEAHPQRFDELADQNEAYVFFTESSQPGAVGSQMVVLTARRSLAVDRAFVAASTPIWVDTRAPAVGSATTQPWRHLLIAQDTGGGIKGPVRGDIYWGDDAAADDVAGRMGGPGTWWLLLPRGVKVE